MSLDDETDLLCQRTNLGVLVRRCEVDPRDKTGYETTSGQADYVATRIRTW